MNYSFNTYLEKNFKEEMIYAAQSLLDEDNVRELSANIVDVSIRQIDFTKLLQTEY